MHSYVLLHTNYTYSDKVSECSRSNVNCSTASIRLDGTLWLQCIYSYSYYVATLLNNSRGLCWTCTLEKYACMSRRTIYRQNQIPLACPRSR